MKRLALVERAPADAGAAVLDALARVLAPLVAKELAAERRGDGLVDVVQAVPASRRVVMRACRAGRITGAVRVGRTWLASRDAVEAWLRTQGPRALPAPSAQADDLDELREALARPDTRVRARRRA